MSALANFAGYQAVWFIAVLGAGRGLAWPAIAGLAAFAAWQLAMSRTRSADLKLVALAIALGTLLDGILSCDGLLSYAAHGIAFPPGGAPLWILALWGAFALTLNHSLAWMRGRRLAAILLGAVGGPLAYLAAARLSGAVSLPARPAAALTALAVGWGGAMFLLMQGAAAWTRDSGVHRANA
jgi:hypothetical protein